MTTTNGHALYALPSTAAIEATQATASSAAAVRPGIVSVSRFAVVSLTMVGIITKLLTACKLYMAAVLGVCRNLFCILLEKSAFGYIMKVMMTVCAIIACQGNLFSVGACLECLMQQTRKPDFVVLLTVGRVRPDIEQSLKTYFPSAGHVVPVEDGAHGWDAGFRLAFCRLNADYVWVLDADSKPYPRALECLLDAPDNKRQIPVSMPLVPGREHVLSMPLLAEIGTSIFAPWKSVMLRDELPERSRIPLRTGWWGALYPREVFSRIGLPKSAFSLNSGNEEYAWLARLSGFQFLLIPCSQFLHPIFSGRLIHYKIAGRSFFYECGLPPELRYYKIRNWAWVQRLRKPRRPLSRLLFCGLYIVLALNAMLRCGEFRPRLIYDLFRALHNGFYGKLRPYAP